MQKVVNVIYSRDDLVFFSAQRPRSIHEGAQSTFVLEKGVSSYSVFMGAKNVHTGQISCRPCFIREIGREVDFRGGLYIYDCRTSKGARNLGAYKFALKSLIAMEGSLHNIYICSLSSNVASCSSILSSGFYEVGRIRFSRWYTKVCLHRVVLPDEIRML